MIKENLMDKMVSFLNKNFNIPINCIEKNVSLSEFEEGLTEKVDMLVSYIDEEGYYTPILIIECVEESILSSRELTLKTLEKLASYDNVVMASRILIASESSMALVRWDDVAGEYVDEDTIPKYEDMALEIKAMDKECCNHDECNCDK